MEAIKIIDNALADPEQYRLDALALPFRTLDFGAVVFHGISPISLDSVVPKGIAEHFPGSTPTLSFLRRSPEGQTEPHFIHTDADMGEWSAILYLTREPVPGDGTTFWRHKETGEILNPEPHARSEEGNHPELWEPVETVEAKFNRLLVFPSAYYHSRAIFNNYGDGDDARLTHVTFGVFKEAA